MECPKCGHKNAEGAAVCSSCYFDLCSGKKPVLPPEPTSPRPSQPTRAAQPVFTASSTPSGAYTPPGQPPAGPPPTVYGAPPVQQGPYGGPPPPQQYSPPYPSALSMDYAGFWSRAAASIVDALVLAIPNALIYAAFGASMLPHMPQGTEPMSAAAASGAATANTVSTLMGAIYMIVMNGAFGATVGKMALGLRIVKTDGSPIGFGTAILRYILELILSCVTIGITYIAVAFTERKQGFHDMIAGTVVIRTR